MSATMIMVPYLLSALYYLKVVVQSSRGGTRQNITAWVFAILGSIYGVWMLYSSGLDQLLISTVLYVPGIAVFAWGKRERGEKVFRYQYELIIAAVLVILAVLYVIRIV
jgi:arginine:ornithine antiporter/lysine permease